MHFTLKSSIFVFKTYLAENIMGDRMGFYLFHACANDTKGGTSADGLNYFFSDK